MPFLAFQPWSPPVSTSHIDVGERSAIDLPGPSPAGLSSISELMEPDLTPRALLYDLSVVFVPDFGAEGEICHGRLPLLTPAEVDFLVLLMPTPKTLNSGRRVATDPAMIPKEGSKTDHTAISLVRSAVCPTVRQRSVRLTSSRIRSRR